MQLRRPRILRRLIALFTWNARDDEMDREMAFHIESITREYVRSGMDEAAAERAARRRFGNLLRLKEQSHDIRSAPLVEDVVRDVRHVWRGLRLSPSFTVAVVLTMALGIGGNTAIFSVVDQLLLRPLPYPDGERLVMVYESFQPGPLTSAGSRNVVSPANWLDWQRENRTLEGLAAWRTFPVTLTGVGEPVRLNMQVVSSEFFPLLGVKPLLGRTVSDQDDRPKAPSVVVLSYQLWQSRFGGDPAVIGRVIQISDQPIEIIGVMPAGFRFVYQDNDLWSAYRLDRNHPWRTTSGRFMNVVARLKTGTTMDAARGEMETIAARLAATYEFNKNSSVTLVPLRELLTGEVRTSLLILYAAVGVLLAIACFNVANLLLARAAFRRREIAIRASLGAGRLAIVRQFLVESLLLVVGGGALGIALANWTLDVLVGLAPIDLLSVPELVLDGRIALYALGVSTLTGLIIGLVPAVLVACHPSVASLRASGSGGTHAPRVRQTLVACQVAMTVILLGGAGLLVRTVMALNNADNGFDKRHLLTMEVTLPVARYTPERRTAFYREAVASLRALPGVESAAAANSVAIIGTPRGGSWFHRFGTPELPAPDRPSALIRVVTPGYFRTLLVPVLRGHEFTEADDANPIQGFVVNEAFAKAFLSDIDPLSASLTVWMQTENPYLPVIGVVGNVSEGSVRGNAQPTIFYSHRQMPETGMTLFVRANQPAGIAAAAVDALHRLDRNLAITKVRTLEGALAESVARDRLNAIVSVAFALTGLFLASLGLYGLLAFLVAERTKEIGIRIALGAQVGRLTRSVVGGGLRLVAVGAGIGIASSLLLLRPLGALLFGVTLNDLPTYASVVALLCVVAALASYIPARRAGRVEPLVALRQE
jgi:putative ABC transport system permease protein